MQSVSRSPYMRLVDRTRAAVPGTALWSALLVFLLTYAIAKSAVTAAWVPGVEVVVLVALAGALVMGLLAVSPLPWAVGAGIGLALGPIVAGIAAGPALRDAFPNQSYGPGLISTWLGLIADGSAVDNVAFDLFLICWLMWVTGGWLSWCVLRWRQPMLGLVPGAAAFATTLLNFPTDQNGYVLTILVLTLALLLWSNYTSSVASASRAKVKLTGDARWDFWESGLVAMAALIVLAIMLPALSTVDRTADAESSAFTSWAKFMQSLSHQGLLGRGSGTGGTTGFTSNVRLGGSLTKSRSIVFTYTLTGVYSGPRYFRGLNLTQTWAGEWAYPNRVEFRQSIPKGTAPQLGEDYEKLALADIHVKMINAPVLFEDILFYPGQLLKADRNTVATEVMLPVGLNADPLVTVDRLSSMSPLVSAGNYTMTVGYSAASTAQLEAAGTSYAAWLAPYTELPQTGYRSPEVLARIHNLAVQVTGGAKNPYDQAAAIEAYLRSPSVFTYTLTPPKTPSGRDPLDYFLFTSHQGYCEFFATAMGDMLRSLGVPTRLVNGFGPGNFETSLSSYVVRGEDAHTWVESYFPAYGWIPFEPTPQAGYGVIERGASGPNLCLRDFNCTSPGSAGTGIPLAPDRPESRGPNVNENAPGGQTPTFSFRLPDAGTMTKIAGVILALVLLLLAGVARYLRPRTVNGVWRRTQVLAGLAGADQRPGETPFEMSRRLRSNFPEATDAMRSLARGFVVAAYAPPEEARSSRASVMEAWSALRPLLLRRVLSRLRPREL